MRISNRFITIGVVGLLAGAGTVALAQRPSHPPVTPEWTYKEIQALRAENQSLRNDVKLLGTLVSKNQQDLQAMVKEFNSHNHIELVTAIGGNVQGHWPTSVPGKFCKIVAKPSMGKTNQVECKVPQ